MLRKFFLRECKESRYAVSVSCSVRVYKAFYNLWTDSKEVTALLSLFGELSKIALTGMGERV
jgi:hypothetical protein